MVSAVVAVDKNWGIGYKGNLLAKIPGDLKHFKDITYGKVVIMGRKTWDSLPKKPLPGRMNIVITSKPVGKVDGAYFWSLDQAKGFIQLHHQAQDVCIIGGGQIYNILLPYCSEVYLTKINQEFEADTYFPQLNSEDWWIPSATEVMYTEDGIPYQFLVYRRKIDISK